MLKENNDVIKGCKACRERSRRNSSKNGKEEIDKYVSKLSPNLKSDGKKAAEEKISDEEEGVRKKFEELDTFINEKQAAFVAKLCDMKNKAIEHKISDEEEGVLKVAEKNVPEARRIEEALSGALSQLIGLVVAALLKFFNWALGLFGDSMDNLEERRRRIGSLRSAFEITKRTLTFMVKHPIDFMSGLFTAVGQGFTQFGDNIQKHLFQRLSATLRVPRLAVWFFNNINRIIEMVKKVFEASANIVEGEACQSSFSAAPPTPPCPREAGSNVS